MEVEYLKYHELLFCAFLRNTVGYRIVLFKNWRFCKKLLIKNVITYASMDSVLCSHEKWVILTLFNKKCEFNVSTKNELLTDPI